jgi:hypothetical protein
MDNNTYQADMMNTADKYDIVVHIVRESDMPEEEMLRGVSELFPKFNNSNTHYDKRITDLVIEQYAYARSVGLSIEDSAHTAEISTILIRKVLMGEGLSLERFMALIEGELYAKSIMKRKHIANLDEASNSRNYQASIAFLEKMYPESYSPKSNVNLSAGQKENKWEIEVTHVGEHTKAANN